MNGIKHYVLGENEEIPYEFVVIRNINGKPEFCASFVNTNYLAYENGVLLKLHHRNDELRAENEKLRGLVRTMAYCMQYERDCDGCSMNGAAGIITERAGCDELLDRLRELGVDE